VRVGRVELLEFRDVFDAFGPRRVGDRSDNLVCGKVNDIRLVSREMRGYQVMVVRVDREIVEELARRPRKIKLRDLLQRWSVDRRRELGRSRHRYERAQE
jgi:hypothetical protein